MMDAERPRGTPWDAFFREVLGLEGDLNREDTERAIEAVAKLAEDAGVAPAEEFSEAVTERLGVDA
ncbi:hypothetical protein [Natrialba swarupiae]|uniref:Uncharacterized protein n=1 Tax=Natrialba swarupiae TaxID=2448032 RepID=A0A5D5AN37_9EURY|nr:hypothetical protein [Natrialba swarupiae]TYT62413.1 hypothetical protein FYC77_07880 [Natrialba swarupiae]